MRPALEYVKQKLSALRPLVGAEVGVWKGDNAADILEHLAPAQLFLVDPYAAYAEYSDFARRHGGDAKWHKWLGTDWDGIYQSVVDRFAAHPSVRIMRMKSPEAAASLNNQLLDFVYIDGNHDLPAVLADLRAWWPKIRGCGVLAGHDHWHRQPGVVEAVRVFAAEIGQKPHIADTNYWFIKSPSPDELHKMRCDEKVDAAYERFYSPSARWNGLRDRVNYVIDRVRTGHVLEIGCGTGLIPILLGNWGMQVTGLDCSGAALEQAAKLRTQQPAAVQGRIRFIECFGENMPFSDGEFDTVIVAETLEHVRDVAAVVKETDRVLDVGGRAILTVPFGGRRSRQHLRTFDSQDDFEAIAPPNWKWCDVRRIDRWIVGYCEKTGGANDEASRQNRAAC